jgi:hypothetical protein
LWLEKSPHAVLCVTNREKSLSYNLGALNITTQGILILPIPKTILFGHQIQMHQEIGRIQLHSSRSSEILLLEQEMMITLQTFRGKVLNILVIPYYLEWEWEWESTS